MFQAGSDSSNKKVKKQKVFKRIVSTDQGDLLFLGIPYKWLKNLGRGTIAIDPTVGIQPTLGNGKDDFMYAANGGDDNHGASGGMQVAPDRTTWERRSVIEFNLEAIPENAAITQATLQLYLYSNWGTATDFTIEAHRMLTEWAEGTGSAWNNNSTTGIDWTYADEPDDLEWQTAGMGSPGLRRHRAFRNPHRANR